MSGCHGAHSSLSSSPTIPLCDCGKTVCGVQIFRPPAHTPLGVTGSNFEMKPEPRHPPAFGPHREVRAGQASWAGLENFFPEETSFNELSEIFQKGFFRSPEWRKNFPKSGFGCVYQTSRNPGRPTLQRGPRKTYMSWDVAFGARSALKFLWVCFGAPGAPGNFRGVFPMGSRKFPENPITSHGNSQDSPGIS